MRNRATAVLFLFLFVFASCLSAQTFRGSIQGIITDVSGAAVAGAQVKISSPGTGLSRSVTTNDQGEYQASELPLGSYNVTVAKQGFRTTTLTQVPVSVGSPARADAKLTAGEVKETVEVSADIPLVETSSNTTGGTIEGAEAAQLPVNGRDFTKLLELVPGTTSDPMGATESAGSYGLFTLNGNRGRSNNYLLDGTDMNDGYRNLPAINQAGVWGCPGTILPIDALAEIPVTGSPEAEFGRSSGATVNIVTKSGSNAIHGTVFEYFRNDALNARNYFNTSDQPKDTFTNHQFGASVGGPIVKDKSFWFLAYEGQQEHGAVPQSGTTPTQYALANAGGASNPVVAALIARQPWGALPQGNPTDGLGGNPDFVSTTFNTPFYNRSNNVIFKLDQHLHLLSSGDLLSGRYFFSNGQQNFPLGMLNTGASAPGSNTITPTHVNVLSLSYTSLPKSNVVLEIRGGYNRFLQQFWPEDLHSFDPTSIGLNTLPPGEPSADLLHDMGMPLMTIYDNNGGKFSTFGASSSVSRGRIDSNYQWFANLSITKGKHNIKTGYEWRRTFINSFVDSGHRGSLSFNSLGDFLGGTIDGGSSSMGSGTRYTFQNNNGAYIQDSWRLTPKLTANYGIRWDYFGVVGEKYHQFSLFDPTTDSLTANVGTPGGPSSLYGKNWNNFAPRLSLADDVFGTGKLVVRSGVAVMYDGASQDFFVGNQPWNTSAAQAGPAFNNIAFSSGPVATIPTNGTPVFQASSYGQTASAFTVAHSLPTPMYFTYNLNIESQIAKKVAVQIGYVGSEGHHLFHFIDINQVNPATGTAPYANFEYINQIETTANSNYNSLQTSLRLQNWHGFTSTLNYTWAHSIDNASDGLDFVPNAAQPDNSYNQRGERASSNFDIRNRLQWYWSYNLPNAHSAKWITNGWALDGMFNYASGQPYTVSYLFEDDYNGSGEWFGRMDVVGNPHAGAHGINLLNLSAFAAPCTWDSVAGACVSGTQHFANQGRNAFNATPFTNFDFSVTKTSHVSEKMTMQLRADVFNLFNHTNFCNPLMPGFSVDAFANGNHAGNAGQLLAGPSSASYLQPTATPDVANGNPYLGGGGPRSVQLAIRFSY